MGNGYWLDPRQQQSYLVTRHELWVLDRENAERAGIPSEIYEHLVTLDPVRHQDEIRLAAIRCGLIRIRDHGNSISVQFSADPTQVSAYLQSVFQLLRDVGTHRFSDLRIDNFANQESVRISLEDLGQQLTNGESIHPATAPS